MRKVILLTLCSAIFLAGAVIYRPIGRGQGFQTTPAAVPNSAADVVAQDVYIDLITLTNTGDATATCTINDKQGSPITIINTTIAAAGAGSNNFVISYPEGGRYAPGGIRWSCDVTTVTGYIAGHYPGAN